MTTQTDPTYLRYIFDGLETKAIHQENISALPEGLIGIYEEALSQEHNVRDRERFLSFFSTWTLLKKEVCASLVSDLLNWPEQHVIDCLSIYTKWFNSPTSGTYILYHERLRVFLLEKISPQKLHFINEKIISLCQAALNQKKGDEWEIYALEHLPAHLLILAIQDEQYGAVFKKLVYHTGYWNRQVEISKGYDWSKKMLNLAMVWAAKQNTDELIECALNKVDLHYMEQNDAPRIVELVAQNDIDTALQRIEAFGGNDKEGFQRKFTLYMLCLMELTLLDSKEQPFRKTAIEKLLKHLDLNTPIDHSLLNWNDFFSSYLMFQLVFEWAVLDIDYSHIFKRVGTQSPTLITDDGELKWVLEKGPYNNFQFDVLMNTAQLIIDLRLKSLMFKIISWQYSKQNRFEESEALMLEAFFSAKSIIDEEEKNRILVDISIELAILGKIEETINCVKIINDEFWKDFALEKISTVFAKMGAVEETLVCVDIMSDDLDKDGILKDISIQLASAGNLNGALSYANSISDESEKNELYKDIYIELIKLGKIEEALSYVYSITDELYVSDILKYVAIELANQKKIEEAIAIVDDINDELTKDITLQEISTILAQQGNFDTALACIGLNSNDYIKIHMYINMSYELFKNDKKLEAKSAIRNAITIANEIENEFIKSYCLKEISIGQYNQGMHDESLSILNESLAWTNQISDESDKCIVLRDISIEFVKRENLEKALDCINGISDETNINNTLSNITTELTKIGILEEAIQVAISVTDKDIQFDLIKAISIEYAKNGKVKEALDAANYIYDTSSKDHTIVDISKVLAGQGRAIETFETVHLVNNIHLKGITLLSTASLLICKNQIESVLNLSLGITNQNLKNSLLSIVASEFTKNLKLRQTLTVFNFAISRDRGLQGAALFDSKRILISSMVRRGKFVESIDIIRNLESGSGYNRLKSDLIVSISVKFAKQGKLNLILDYVRTLKVYSWKSKTLSAISTELINSNIANESSIVLYEALKSARDLSIESIRCDAFSTYCIELAKQENLNDSLEYINEITIKLDYIITLMLISTDQHLKGKLDIADSLKQEALKATQSLSAESELCKAMMTISVELVKQRKYGEASVIMNEALELCKNGYYTVWNENLKRDYSIELAKNGEFVKAIAFANTIKDNNYSYGFGYNQVLNFISQEFANKGHWKFAEKVGFNISQFEQRQKCWRSIARIQNEENSSILTMDNFHQFKSDEAQNSYLNGWVKSINVNEISKAMAHKVIQAVMSDSSSLEHFLQIYAQHELFFGNSSKETIDRLDRTLNLKWALDIIDQFPKEEQGN